MIEWRSPVKNKVGGGRVDDVLSGPFKDGISGNRAWLAPKSGMLQCD